MKIVTFYFDQDMNYLDGYAYVEKNGNRYNIFISKREDEETGLWGDTYVNYDYSEVYNEETGEHDYIDWDDFTIEEIAYIEDYVDRNFVSTLHIEGEWL